jgi:hypothetical protein
MEFLQYPGGAWMITGLKCDRCGEDILREVRADYTLTDHFCCKRNECTWPDYEENIAEIKRRLRGTKEEE